MTLRRDRGYLLIDLVAATLIVVFAVLPLLLELGSVVTERHRDATRLELGAELERLRGRIFFEPTEPPAVRVSGVNASGVRGVPAESRSGSTDEDVSVQLLWYVGQDADWIVLKASRGDVEELLVVPIPSR